MYESTYMISQKTGDREAEWIERDRETETETERQRQRRRDIDR